MTGERSGELEAVLVDGVERLDVYFRLFLSKVIVAGISAVAIVVVIWIVDPVVGMLVAVFARGAGGDPALRVPGARVAHAVLVRQLPPARRGVRRRAAGDGDPEDVRGGAPAGRGPVPPRPRRARLGDPADRTCRPSSGDHGVHRGRRRGGRARGRCVPARRRRDHRRAAHADPAAGRRVLPARPRDQRGDAPGGVGHVEVRACVRGARDRAGRGTAGGSSAGRARREPASSSRT